MDCVFDVLIDWHYRTQVHLGFLLCYLLGAFIALHFIFRSVIHLSQFLWKLLDLHLYSFFFLWHIDVQLFQHHLLKRLPCSVLLPLFLLLYQRFVVIVQLLNWVLCNPMDCSTPGFPVLDYFLEFAQTHVHWAGERKENESHSVMSDCLWTHGLYSPWNSLGQNTGVGSLSLLKRIFLTQESNQGLLHCRWILYQLSYQGNHWVSNAIQPSPPLSSPSPSAFNLSQHQCLF